jgi:hypothetical protein
LIAPMSARPTPPSRLPLAGDAWVRFRRVPGVGGKVLLTGATGRFLLLPDQDFEALSRGAGDPASPQRRKLADLGFLHGPAPVGALEDATGVWRHVVFLNGARTMTEATARSVVDRILESPSGSLRIELRGAEPLADPPLLRLVVGLARAGSRAAGKQLSLAILTSLGGATGEICDFLIDEGVAIAVHHGEPSGAAARAIRELHERHAARGIGPADALVNGVVTVTRATLAAGPRALVSACVDAGLAFVQLRPEVGCATDAYLGFQREFMRRLLEVNLAGTFLVDMRLALHLEALVESARAPVPARAAVEALAYGPDGRVHARAAGPLLDDRFAIGDAASDRYEDLVARAARALAPGRAAADTCAACVYDPYCGGPLLGPYLMDDGLDEKAWGNGYCATSMGTFDAVFELLASAEGPALRRVFQRWMAAHERIAKRLGAA